MPRTPEQKQADAELREAINRVCRLDWADPTPDGVLVDFAVVAHYTSFDAEGDEVSAYYLLYPNGAMPEHRAVGLWQYGIHLVTQGRRVEEGGEEEV